MTAANQPGAEPASQTDSPSGESPENGAVASRYMLFNAIPSWLVSFMLHLLLIVLLALVFLPDNSQPPIAFEVSDVSGEQLESLDVDLDSLDLDTAMNRETVEQPELKLSELPLPNVVSENLALDPLTDTNTDLAAASAAAVSGGGEFSGRTAEGRASARKFGASTESEQSVDLALEWLARHQLEDGSWNFDHAYGPGPRSKLNPGMFSDAVNGATALALLPFLGAGNTHVTGQYRENVAKGLNFLRNNGKVGDGMISWHEPYGRMYSHGMVAIVFCEAYAMTGDQSLREPATGAIRFIEYAQDPRGGGWRYEPREPGDTSVVGWQIMALKSAKMGGIEVKADTWKDAKTFLRHVSSDYGWIFGYTRSAEDPDYHKACTAIGLLCQMYLGWSRERPALVEGVAWLGKRGPSMGTRTNPDGANMYFNYYATQVMRQYGGELWKTWNAEMRDYLVATQATTGDERGSWYFSRSDDISPEAGGRLYCTAMSAMTLEVYYRFMPLYENRATEDFDFPLD